MQKLFDEFDLNTYGRNGLEADAGLDDSGIIAGDHQFKDITYIHKVHRIQVDEALHPGQAPKSRPPFDP